MPLDLKKIKSLFIIEEDPQVKSREKQPPEKVAGSEAAASQVETGKQATKNSEPGKVSDKLMQVLLSAMEQQNLPGLDYMEYKQSLNSLEKMPMEEPVRYQSAFAMAQAMGATSQKLIESATHYLDVLKNEQAKFQQTLDNQKAEQIESRQNSIQNLEAELQQKGEQIEKLTQEMEQHRQKMEKAKSEINESKAKLESMEEVFQATYNKLNSQILTDIENMKRHLK